MADRFRPCSVENCNGNASPYAKGARGYCNAHYKRLLRHGSPTGGKGRRSREFVKCRIASCDRRLSTDGLCAIHYQRWKRTGDPLCLLGKPTPANDYFHDVVLPYDGDDCLIWPFNRRADGYAMLWHEGKSVRAPRMICEELLGEPPTSKHEAAHSCGKGHLGCVNPKHLRWATPAENDHDKIDHGTRLRGSRSPVAKLTEDEVLEIRRLIGQLSFAKIGAIFGVSRGAISSIRYGRSWAWME